MADGLKSIICIIITSVITLGLVAWWLHRILKKNEEVVELYETEYEDLLKNRFSIGKVLFELLKSPKETIRSGMLGMYDHRGIWIWFLCISFLNRLINLYTRKQLSIFFLIGGVGLGLVKVWFCLNIMHLLFIKCCGVKISFDEAKHIIGMTVLGLCVVNLGVCIVEDLLLLFVPKLDARSWQIYLTTSVGLIWSGYILVKVLIERYGLSIKQSVKKVILMFLISVGVTIGTVMIFSAFTAITILFFALH